MEPTVTGLEALSDAQVEAALLAAVKREAEQTAGVLRALLEFERRRLHERKPYGSLYEFCVHGLRYSEQAAYKRIQAARAAAKYPVVLELIESRKLDLSNLVIVAPHLSLENHSDLLAKASCLGKRDLEFFVAGLAPQEIGRDSIRNIPVKAHFRSPPDSIKPVTAELARILITADRQTVEGLDRACELLHCGRSNLGPVLARAVEALLREIDPALLPEPRRSSAAPKEGVGTAPPSSGGNQPLKATGSRYVPRHVKRLVWKRDGGRCTFVDEAGVRCCATTDLEVDHIKPWAAGGRSDDASNLRLRCRLHNLAAARDWFGTEKVDQAIESDRAEREADAGRGPP